jgi:hypothetical protein
VLLVLGYIAAFGTIADMRLHQSVEERYGVNMRGYRGPVVRQRKLENVRVALLGGRWAFGSGLLRAQSPAFYLHRNLHQRWRPGNTGLQTAVVNLAGPGDGPASYVVTLEDYRSLDADVICLLDDPDRAGGSPNPWRHQSALFRRTGYFPLLTRAGSADGPMPPASAAARENPDASAATTCEGGMKPYCDGLAAAIEYGIARGRRVLVVRPPAATPGQRAREDAASAMLAARFGQRADVRMVDLSRAQELFPAASAPPRDLTAGEADRLAELMTPPMLELITQ